MCRDTTWIVIHRDVPSDARGDTKGQAQRPRHDLGTVRWYSRDHRQLKDAHPRPRTCLHCGRLETLQAGEGTAGVQNIRADCRCFMVRSAWRQRAAVGLGWRQHLVAGHCTSPGILSTLGTCCGQRRTYEEDAFTFKFTFRSICKFTRT